MSDQGCLVLSRDFAPRAAFSRIFCPLARTHHRRARQCQLAAGLFACQSPRRAMVRPRAALSSDSDPDKTRSPPHKRSRRGTLPTSSRAASPKPAVKKSPAKSPAKPKPKPVYKPITSFFSNVPRPQPTPSPEKAASTLHHDDDILDSSDEDPQPAAALPVRKSVNAVARQKFLRPASETRSTAPSSQPPRQDAQDRRPWTEQYGPTSLEELAVHKKKTADVRAWLTDVFSGRERKPLLLLKGPAGSGKTTTLTLLCRELGYNVQEWKNPIGTMPTSDAVLSTAAQFEDFIGRTGTFGSLAFDGPSQSVQQSSAISQTSKQKQIILVEEFPNTFTRTSSAVQSFRSAILNYLATNTLSATAFFSNPAAADQSVTPIVMIISETLLSTNTAAADSFTAHRLLGPEILTHPGVSVIEFNPIAPTYMTKALDAIVLKEARKSGRRNTLGPQVIQRLAELGDIRSAVSSLEFLCLRGDDAEGWGAKVNFSKKKGPKDVAITKMEQESLEMVTRRESTLGIFHSVGRVVYNKRLAENPEAPAPQPPNWFPEKRRPKASEVNVNALIDELGTDTQTFVAALHENYVLSCGGADSEETMDSIAGCVEALSDADLLSPDRFGAGAGRRNFQGTTADNHRQDEMCFQTSVRGLLFNLPHPVKRMAPPPGIMGVKAKGQGAGSGAPMGNAFVMYYPASLRIWKQQEEIGGLLEMWISRAQRGELFASRTGTSQPPIKTGGVETWRRNTSFSTTSTTESSGSPENTKPAPPILLGSGGSARYEMLLERLPYLTHILRKPRMPSPSQAATVREIQKITSIGGKSVSQTAGDDEENDEDQGLGEHEQWSTDKPGVATPRKRRRLNLKSKEQDQESVLSSLVDKGASLILSDDDIED